ncbi:MAG TPA: IPT/TIG domain-containing protein [Acidimicrobiales bacterium]|nr:IPT/TIG domain-containing protein [Acidimicrobiales bacterium]
MAKDQSTRRAPWRSGGAHRIGQRATGAPGPDGPDRGPDQSPWTGPLKVLCLIVLAGLMGLGAFLAYLQVGPSHTVATSKPPATPGATQAPSTQKPGTTPKPPGTKAPPTTAPSPAPAGGGPHLASIAPAAGGAGTTVHLTGTGLFSANGHITVTFAGTRSSVHCPSRSQCDAVVPSLGHRKPGPIKVVLTTAAGPSNPERFTYRG